LRLDSVRVYELSERLDRLMVAPETALLLSASMMVPMTNPGKGFVFCAETMAEKNSKRKQAVYLK
jgi:hypothetical protein